MGLDMLSWSGRFAILAALCLIDMGRDEGRSADQTKRGVEAMTVPDGYVVEMIAAPPLTLRPMMGGFDDRGRLYLAESAGENLEAKDLLAKTPNFIRRLSDEDGDGRFDSSTIFADKMTFPMGALWYRGSVYSASPPYIWKLFDADDDGVAEKREILVGAFGFIGNAADIHGCFLSPGGRIYWCDGRHGHEFLDEKGQVLSKGKAARIFSCRPDGSDVRWHAGGGMDNPVEVDFLPEGPTLGVVNLFYPKRGDCLVHWLHGGVYPREDMPVQISEFKRTGELLGPVHDFGHVAVAGCLRYQSRALGEDFEGNWFVCHFNTHQVARVKLMPSGSSYTAASQVFLTSSDPDFHPTDVIEDADGSLIVVDTGGWFRNGCPTSQLAKPDITGGLYRIRRVSAPPINDPRGMAIDWNAATDQELARYLADQRFTVREKAKDLLAQRIAATKEESPTVRQLLSTWEQASAPQRREILWTLTRAGRSVPPFAFEETDESVRHAAAVACQDRPTAAARDGLIARLTSDPSPAVKREAATALGMLGPGSTAALLEAAGPSAGDRSLEHAIIYALIESSDWNGVHKGLASDRSSIRRAALIALDQIDPARLERGEVVRLLDTSDQALLRTALEVIGKRSGWSEAIIGLVQPWLNEQTIDADRGSMLRGILLAFQREESVQKLVGDSLAKVSTASPIRQLLLDVAAKSELTPLPAPWIEGIRSALLAGDRDIQQSGLEGAARSVDHLSTELRSLVSMKSPLALRAARLLATLPAPLDESTWRILIDSVQGKDPLERVASADAIGGARLSSEQQREVIQLFSQAGPIELGSLLRTFERKESAELLAGEWGRALGKAPSRGSISLSRLEQLAERVPSSRDSLSSLIAENRDRRGAQAEKIRQIVEQVAGGNVDRGEELFHSPRTSCSGCHAVGGKGGQIGPDLSKIGASRTAGDLAESILLPSASLARGYESVRVVTESGSLLTGVIARETIDAIWLRTADRSETRIARDQIDEISPSTQSIMPEGLDQGLKTSEAADLIAYLLQLR